MLLPITILLTALACCAAQLVSTSTSLEARVSVLQFKIDGSLILSGGFECKLALLLSDGSEIEKCVTSARFMGSKSAGSVTDFGTEETSVGYYYPEALGLDTDVTIQATCARAAIPRSDCGAVDANAGWTGSKDINFDPQDGYTGEIELEGDRTDKVIIEFDLSWQFSGARASELIIGDGEVLQIESSEDDEVWHCSTATVESGGAIRIKPLADLTTTVMQCKVVSFSEDSKLTIHFPEDYEPQIGDFYEAQAIVADDLQGANNVKLTVVTNAHIKMLRDSQNMRIKGDLIESIESSIDDGDVHLIKARFDFEDGNVVPATTQPPAQSKDFLAANLVYLVIGAVALLLCVAVCGVTFCFVRRVAADANAPFDDLEDDTRMQSARYSTSDHSGVAAYNTAPNGDDAYDDYVAQQQTRTSTMAGGSMSYAPPGTVASGAGSTLAGAPPPPPSDYNDSVYAAVPQAIRTANDPWEINEADLQMGATLGEGAYGTVNKATYKGVTVAVKRMHANLLSEKDIKAFKKEAKLMKTMDPHPNVVMLVGVNTDETRGELFIVTEFCGGGACDEYLKKYGHLLTQPQRLSMMVAAARGVEHLHKQNIIHRDLACRNFLLTSEGGLKVADFGMSRDTQEDGNQTKCEVGPLRYMSPESMARRVYSVESDVWAFGVVMWEIESNAATPYGDTSLTMVAIGVAKEGLRLDQPQGCPDQVYALMHKTWAHKPEDRPGFPEIVGELIDCARQYQQ